MKIKASVSFGPQRFFIRLIKARSSIFPLYLHLHEPESTCSTVWQYHFQHFPSASLLWSVLISRYRNIANVHGELVCYYNNLRFIFFSNRCGNGRGSLAGGRFWGNKRKGLGGGYKKKDWEHAQVGGWLRVLEDVYRAMLFWKGQAAGSQWSSVRCSCWWLLISRTP